MPDLARLDERPISLAQLVYDKLREAIIDKSLPPGSSISETDLARRFAVSKTPVREAILRLIETGLILGEGRDQQVIWPSEATIIDAYETRVALEQSTVVLSALRATPAEHDELHVLAEQSVSACEAGDSAAFRDRDSHFHRRIATLTRNSQLARLVHNALDLTNILRLRDVPMSNISMRCAEDHVKIASAIAQSDGETARTLVVEHINVVRDRVLLELKNFEPIGKDLP